jgi:hypothetical protein
MVQLQLMYQFPHDRWVSLETLAQQPRAYKEHLSDAEQLNYAWIQVVEDGAVLHEAQPFSLSVFLDLLSRYFQLFVEGRCIWLYGLESTFVFHGSAGNLDLFFWKDVDVNRLRPYIAKEIASGIFFEMVVSPEHLPRHDENPFRIQLPTEVWLRTILHWGTLFSQLIAEVTPWLTVNSLDVAPDSVQAIREIDAFRTHFRQCESALSAAVVSRPSG